VDKRGLVSDVVVFVELKTYVRGTAAAREPNRMRWAIELDICAENEIKEQMVIDLRLKHPLDEGSD